MADYTYAPARRVRRAPPRVCANCGLGSIADSVFECARPGGFSCDTGEMEHWFHVCEGYRPPPGTLNVRHRAQR